jgi:hypothetical protein
MRCSPSKSVKALDSFSVRANAEPSPGENQGRCREQTAGTYGHKAMVKACSRLRTRTIRVRGGESRSSKKIRRP